MAVGPHILAIDLGTSGPKVALVSASGELLDCAFAPTGVLLFPGGGAEQDPHEWWRAIVTASRELAARRPEAAAQVVAVCCTAQWSGTVPVDRQGRPIGNAIIWMDSRGAPCLMDQVKGPVRVAGFGVLKLWRLLRITGGAPGRAGKDAISHILFLRRHRPEVYDAAYKFLEPKDYLNLKLTGLFAASTESITLHWVTDTRDPASIRYDPKLLRMFGLEREKLPDLKAASDVLGPLLPEAAAELGVPATAKVVMGTPDIHAATLGAGAVPDFASELYLGTSSFLTCHVAFARSDVIHNLGTIPSAIPGRYLVANTQESAGVCLANLLEQHVYPDDELALGRRPADAWARLDRAVASVPPGSDKLVFTPWLYGERTPVDDATLRGGFFNQSLKTTRRHMARAVLEGVAYNTRWVFHYFQRLIGRKVGSLVLIGGGALSAQWCQIHADVLGCTIRQAANPLHANAMGAAFLASCGLGYLGFSDLAQRVPIARTFEPDPAHRRLYDELFEAFVEIYRRNKKLYARLNRQAGAAGISTSPEGTPP